MKFRIITDDRKYMVQSSTWGILWKTLSILVAYDYYQYIDFDSEEEARSYIVGLENNEKNNKIHSKRKWKVLK